jgi:hypothetical protein
VCHRYDIAGTVSTDAVMGGESGRIAIELNKSEARVVNMAKCKRDSEWKDCAFWLMERKARPMV